MTPSELLFKAADVLEERGWVKGCYVCKDGKVCAEGAMRLAAGEQVTLDTLTSRPYIRPPLGNREHEYYVARNTVEAAVGENIALWNDTRRSVSIIVNKFRSIARKLAKEGR